MTQKILKITNLLNVKRMDKKTLLKIVPNNGELKLTDCEPVIIYGTTTIVWAILRDGKKLWVDMEEDNNGWVGRFLYPFDDCARKLKKHIYKHLEKINIL